MPNKTIFLSSSQATSKDLTKGIATWQLRNQIQFDNAEIGLFNFSFVNYFVNISAALGNNHIFYSDDALNETKYDCLIPDGSYSVDALNDFVLAHQQATLGFQVFAIVPNYSTAKCGIQFANVVNWFVHFAATSPFTLMGFALNQNVPNTKANTAFYIEYGANIAAFNNVTLLKVAIDLTTDAISNGDSSSIIYQTGPVVEVGSTQNNEPANVLWTNLTIPSFSQITARILDQNDAPLYLYEDFSLTLSIQY
jgi:hypothetical protein